VIGQSGAVYCQGTLDNRTWHISRAGISPLGDQIVEAIVRIDDFYAATSLYMAAVFARYDSQSDSGYLLALRGDGRAILRKRTQGTTASWAPGPDLGIVPGHWYTVRLEVVGATVTAFVDGTFVMAATDTAPIANGTIALGTYGATMEIQSVVVAKP
jgi:pectate lyase